MTCVGRVAHIAATLALLLLIAGSPAHAQAFRFGPDDTFTVRGEDTQELGDKPYQVDSSGDVTMPLVGRIRAGGLTITELENAINERLKKFVRSPAVTVSVGEVKSRPISVVGSVTSSAVYQARSNTTLIEMITMAGGLRPDAGTVITVTRSTSQGALPLTGATLDPSQRFWVGSVDAARLMAGSLPDANIVLLANDVVSVPRADLVYVIGDVNRAGAIPMTSGRLTLTQALARSEGLQRSASRQNVRILREPAAGGEPQEMTIDFQRILNGKATDLELLPNDIVVIPTNVSKLIALRTLEAALQIGTGLVIWR